MPTGFGGRCEPDSHAGSADRIVKNQMVGAKPLTQALMGLGLARVVELLF